MDALFSMTAVEIDHFCTTAGRNELRARLGVGGLLGRAVDPAQERRAEAARQGLRDGRLGGAYSADLYAEADERAWYAAGFGAGSRA
jgi:hypothetical protein